MEVLGAGSNTEYVKLLRMLETWLLVVMPDEFVALEKEPADGWKPLPTATLERYVQFGATRGSLCVSVPLRCCRAGTSSPSGMAKWRRAATGLRG